MGSAAERNVLENLRNNVYPGRGIVIGAAPGGTMVQVYWIMGRSENSRNRVFREEGGCVQTAAFDESKVEDPSLIIYNAIRTHGQDHIVTNGDQTDTICDHLAQGKSFAGALATRTYEPDGPNYTPRISGMICLAGTPSYALSILKTQDNDPERPVSQFFNYASFTPGTGHCITTYAGDGNPLPSFTGEPYTVPLAAEAAGDIAAYFWDNLDADNRISLAVKTITGDGETALHLVNKHG